ARVASRGDRSLPLRRGGGVYVDRRPRPRRQPAVRDAALRRDRQVRRSGASRPRAVGDRADRRSRRALRLSRARQRRRAHRGALDRELVRSALTPHVELAGGHLGYRIVDTGRIRPQLSDLNVSRVDGLEPALHAWRSAAFRYWSVDGWLEVESIAPLLGRLDA